MASTARLHDRLLTTADAEEHPGIDSQAKTKGQCNVNKSAGVGVISDTGIAFSGA